MQFCKLISIAALRFIAYSLATPPAAFEKASRKAQSTPQVNSARKKAGSWLTTQPTKSSTMANQRVLPIAAWKTMVQSTAFQMSIVSRITPKAPSGQCPIASKTMMLLQVYTKPGTMSQATSLRLGSTSSMPSFTCIRAFTVKRIIETTSLSTSTVTTAQAGLKEYLPPFTLAAFLMDRSMEMERLAYARQQTCSTLTALLSRIPACQKLKIEKTADAQANTTTIRMITLFHPSYGCSFLALTSPDSSTSSICILGSGPCNSWTGPSAV
mmetsp:Transcript_47133/g.108960  ORF Transcript_47133/g.108960 Transcript_47133/m.108960 type:complete len:269 (-) Transcript_47133:293-1099(-)